MADNFYHDILTGISKAHYIFTHDILNEQLESASTFAHYKLNDNLATTNVVNERGIDGTLVNAGNTSAISVAGKIDRALHFDGTNDHVDISLATFNIEEGAISLWFKLDTTTLTENKYMVGRNQGGNYAGDLGIQIRSADNTIQAYIQDGVSTPSCYSEAINDTDWHWLLWSWSPDECRLYIDNVLVDIGTGTDLEPHASSYKMAIGANTATSSGFEWDGLLEDVRIFTHVPINAERNFIYNDGDGTYDEYDDGVKSVGHYKLNDDADNSTVIDSSFNEIDGTLVNNQTWYTSEQSTTGKINECFDFDGSADYVIIDDVCKYLTEKSFSFALWFQTTATGYDRFIGFNSSTGGNIYLCGTYNGKVSIFVTGDAEHTGSTTVNDGNWHHVFMLFDVVTQNCKVYLDGSTTPELDFTQTRIVYGNSKCSIGQEWDTATPSNFWDGKIDDVRFYDRLITEEERSQIYNNGDGTEEDLPLEALIDSTDTINISDELNINIDYTDSDEIVISDEGAINRQRTIEDSESILVTDDISQSVLLSQSDLLTISDEITFSLEEESQDEFIISDEVRVSEAKSIDLNETILFSDEKQISRSISLDFDESVILDEDSYVNLSKEIVRAFESFTISDSIDVSVIKPVYNAVKILSYNPLVLITDTDPVQLVKIDISTPTNPTWSTYVIDASGETVRNAKDICFNDTFDFLYIACADGQILQVNINNFNDREQIDTGDSDDLLHIDTLDNFHQIYTGTDDSEGEIITLDKSEIKSIDFDIRFLEKVSEQFSLRINTVEAHKISTDIRFLAPVSQPISLDIRFLANTFSDIAQNPIKRTDFHVYINGSEVDDVKLDSISIYHVIDEDTVAIFILARKHDKLDYTLTGTSSQITNQNSVKIYIKNNLEFNGKISQLECNSEEEIVTVTALMSQPSSSKKSILLPMSSLNEQLHLYHILLHDPVIFNPYIDPNEEDPAIHKGIEIEMGTAITQNVLKEWSFQDGVALANNVSEGKFQPKQNWTYFWFAGAVNFIIGGGTITQRYIGTSLSSMTGDAWDITSLAFRWQREFENDETELSVYQVGSPPYKTISVRNGTFSPKKKYVDEDDGLYVEKDEGYDYEEYAKEIANIEYQMLTNINGDILPQTSADVELFVDGYYYYTPKLLTRINIGNTTTSNIYKNNNGFPLAVKSIEINSSNMRVSLRLDNQKSREELEELENSKPDYEEYITPAYKSKQFSKYDFANGEWVV